MMKKIDDTKYFILSSSCVLTKGASRTLIQDFQRSYVDFVPNEFYDLCQMLDRQRISDIAAQVDETSLPAFYHFVELMLAKEYAFVAEDVTMFPKKAAIPDENSLVWDAIMEIDMLKMPQSVDEMAVYKPQIPYAQLLDFASQLRDIDCRQMQLHIYHPTDFQRLHCLLHTLATFNFNLMEVHLAADVLTFEQCCRLILEIAAITHIYLYDAPSFKHEPYVVQTEGYFDTDMGSVFRIPEKLDKTHCGTVNKYCQTFGDERFYTMSRRFNNCLYKRVCLDREGYVRHCPSFPHAYELKGSLKDIILSTDFQRVWSISKDKVSVCKDCEFRYNCLDCRVYAASDEVGGQYNEAKNVKVPMGKPLTCRYDPYHPTKK